jgi:hypothetical protein
MILYDLCLLPAQFHYIITNIRHLESDLQLGDRCAPRKFTSGAENLIFQAADLITFPNGPRYTASARTTQKTPLPTVPLLSSVDSLLRKRVYRAVA